MRIRLLALALACAATLCGQRLRTHPFSWQDYCFNHPAAPFCQGRDYAVKNPPMKKDTQAPGGDATPYTAPAQTTAPSVVVVGGVDWRFVDPLADAIAVCHCKNLTSSPAARNLIAQLAALQRLDEADTRKIIDQLSAIDQIAFSVRDNRVVAMLTGRIAGSTPPAAQPGLKTAAVSGNALLVGHAEAVDEALRRIAAQQQPPDFARLAEQRQPDADFWAVGSPELIGPDAASGGARRFSMTVFFRERFLSETMLEFEGAPTADALRMWPAGTASIEGSAVHVRMPLDASQAQQNPGQITDSPIGRHLAALIVAARYLPAPDPGVQAPAKVVIYGLAGGPKEVNLGPVR